MSSVSPMAVPAFRRLFSAQVIALVGTGLTTVALALLAYDMAGDDAGLVLGTALAVKMIAYVVFAPIVGGLAHRFRRKPLLIGLDVVRAGVVLLMPFVTQVWHIYLLIFLLNLFSAGFKPVFAATIPDILEDEESYTKALSYSRLAYDLENLLSPTFAALALLVFSYSGLFQVNAIAFLISAGLIAITALPKREPVDRLGGLWAEISFGLVAYFRTPRLRGLLALYGAVSLASAMVIVNTVVHIRGALGGSETDTALAFAAAGAGSMIAALSVPRILLKVADRPVMITGAVCMAVGLLLMATEPSMGAVLPIWFLIGLGWSLVQTPAGRVVNRSSSAKDRSAYFSAQFALSHACWLIAYPIAGQLANAAGLGTAALCFGVAVLGFAVLSLVLWPTEDAESLAHTHDPEEHKHLHSHGPHHQHPHEGWEGPEPHSHDHRHAAVTHAHAFVIDEHHLRWPSLGEGQRGASS